LTSYILYVGALIAVITAFCDKLVDEFVIFSAFFLYLSYREWTSAMLIVSPVLSL